MPLSAPPISPDSFSRFGELLRYLRRRARITQRYLSIAVGYNFTHICRLEQGQRAPDPVVVAAVFVPALGLVDEPQWAQRLIALAAAARHDQHNADTLHEEPPDAATPDAPHPRSSPPLLATKLYVPHARAELVPRLRLFAELDRALRSVLTLIAAPAGFGKTTLLTAWLNQRAVNVHTEHAPVLTPAEHKAFDSLHVSWLSLDEGDNEPTTFLRYLIAALQTVAPLIGNAALTMMQSAQPPGIDTIARLLSNDLMLLPATTLLVLDDYHLITTPAIHTALTLLLEHLPPTVHILIATRSEPPLPLARLRARGQLVEVRAADMRFTTVESAAFLTNTMGLSLSANNIAALETRTEGWVAGLQLAALAMRQRSDPEGFIRAFTGSNRFVTDYLISEVFARQPSHLQTFLLRTSMLDRLCGPLCDAVMGINGESAYASGAYAQLLLEELERANLFLIPLDDERQWFRYHHLFGAMLRERLVQGEHPANVAQLHARASAWFVAAGLIDEALQHALAAGDQTSAAELVEQRAAAMLQRDDFMTLRRWLDALPEALVMTRPVLCLARARLAILGYDLLAGERWLACVDATGLPHEQHQITRVETLTIQMQLCLYRNDLQTVFALAEQALALLPDNQPLLRVDIMQRKAAALLWSGQLAAALVAFDEVRRLSEVLGDAHMLIAGVSNGSATLVTLAQLHAAEQHVQHYIRHFAQQPSHAMPALAALFLEQAEIYYQWNDLERADSSLREARVRCEHANMPRALFTVYLLQARLASARGDVIRAQSFIHTLRDLVQRYAMPIRYTAHLHTMQVDLWLQTGNLHAAQAWADTLDTSADDLGFLQFFEVFGWLRALIACGALERASTFLAAIRERAEAAGYRQHLLQIVILQAIASFRAQPDSDAAFGLLARALALGEPEQYIRMFVDEGEAMAALLQAAQQRGHASPYVARLLAAFSS